jgi:cellulose synthase/poly-beta-1,6-N-acetylglucosamine synthase-like glycosyltransferase
MTTLAAVVAWTALLIVAYVYVGYPLTLWVLARLRRREVRQAEAVPPVTLIISAYNEARSIQRKLENALALDYPSNRLQIVVVSDASTDRTDEIVEKFTMHGVTLLRMPSRGGKTTGLNAAVRIAGGDIVVFSDANILYQRDAIRCLVQNFTDPSVGCVTGDSRYVSADHGAAHVQENTYWGYERFIRSLESEIGSMVGGDGAIFAIRRSLYTPLPAEAINDLVIPLQIVERGYRAVFERSAIGLEPSAGHFSGEFRRKRRIVNRSWRGVMSVRGVLDPRRVGLFAWQVWSHKVARWLVLPLMVAGAAACFVASPLGIGYRLVTWGFVASLGAAVLGAVLPERAGGVARVPHAIYYFYMVNIAATLGIVAALAGRVEVTWTSERSEA